MKTNEHGYVLLEALVGLLIFSIGILGVMGFQAVATKSTTDSRFRVEAAMLADELIAWASIDDPASLTTKWCNQAYVTQWLTNRSGIPAVSATVNCPATPTPPFTADITITWGTPGMVETGQYTTSARIEAQ